MLAVAGRSGERRFWGPNAVKPLNFNYDFTPNAAGQNIWTLTDGLFVPDTQRSIDDEEQKALRVIYSRGDDRKTQSAKAKRSSCYQHFPTIDENFTQKSSAPARSRDSENLKTSNSISETSRMVSSGSSLSSRVTPPQDFSASYETVDSSKMFTLARRNQKSGQKEKLGSTKKPKELSGEKPFTTSPQGCQKKQEQKDASGKLSLEETERLLKSLDFRVRTRKKVQIRERSKSDRVRKSPFMPARNPSPATKMPFQKRGVVGDAAKERFGVKKKKIPCKTTSDTSENQLVRSSRKTSWQTSSSDSSRKKSLSSTSGLGDLLGPLPRVKWTPELCDPKPRSCGKKSSEKSSVTLMKARKMKAVLKKAADRDSLTSQAVSEKGISEEEGSSREAVSVRKVRTTTMKIIPKVTINNQLLKSTTSKNEKLQDKKVATVKDLFSNQGPQKMTGGKKLSTFATLWTPDKIALLDKITSDQQLKTVLMSAGDTYMKSRRHLRIRSPRPLKAPQKAVNTPKTPAATKTTDLSKTPFKQSPSTCEPSGSSGKQNPNPVEASDQPSEGVAADIDAQDVKATGKSKKIVVATRKTHKTTDFQVKAKPTVIKSKGIKISPKTGDEALVASGKKDVASGAKRRQKNVTSAKERLAHMTSEAVGPARIQSDRTAQIRRSNLDTLKKILDKSLSASNKLAKHEEVKSAKVS